MAITHFHERHARGQVQAEACQECEFKNSVKKREPEFDLP